MVLAAVPTRRQVMAARRTSAVAMSFGLRHGVAVVDVAVDGDDPVWSLVSAVRHLDRAGVNAVRVWNRDLVALPDIAERCRVDRERIRALLVDAGPGGTPPPVNPGRPGTVLYRWVEMVPWLRDRAGFDLADVDPTLPVANLLLQVRQSISAVYPLVSLLDR